ncbi:Zinc finger, C3HC4 type (RING finger) [Geosmithia morbida]|uniref:Zinc finger, C3HC4 type (RING finger) n=1 Tax=Geosmithia morbida TaxID=1094350 RepID=A0A9P4YXH3_9HYPO|nr:Zinc finger, C3HC4 type (RING finger) [Geosmithia morbida]KAF4123850.1 Zinc finger, C3HC4 type (RING finger) [Geosmithia morbida]
MFTSLKNLALWLGFILPLVGSAGADVIAWTSPSDSLPDWASESTLQLSLSTSSTNYAIIPLTDKLAAGQSGQISSSTISIKGDLKAADDSNYDTITSSGDVAYMTCDQSDTATYITPDKMLNELMKQAPKAIVLYSTEHNWCSLGHNGDLDYTAILSMTDTGESASVLAHLNETSKSSVGVSIYGSANKETSIDNDGNQSSGDGKSAVAMSVLYSITGLVTFLFLVIIVNGAIRAHRHPERYGPRRAAPGRPRQSRAKGLARAVLETLPVIKFGDQQPSKPDPELETIDDAITAEEGRVRDPAAAQGAAAADASPNAAAATSRGATAPGPDTQNRAGTSASSPRTSMERSETAAATSGIEGATAAPRASTASQSTPEALGCSICTDDFKVGEDVRVLPRLDLRPGQASGSGTTNEGQQPSTASESLPPPLNVGSHGGSHETSGSPDVTDGGIDVNRLRCEA